MWREQLWRRNLLKEKIDFKRDLSACCEVRKGKKRSRTSLCWINIKYFIDINILTVDWTAHSAEIQRISKVTIIHMWYCLVLFLLSWEKQAEIHWFNWMKIQFPPERTCLCWFAFLICWTWNTCTLSSRCEYVTDVCINVSVQWAWFRHLTQEFSEFKSRLKAN